jgi:hypothetical protein
MSVFRGGLWAYGQRRGITQGLEVFNRVHAPGGRRRGRRAIPPSTPSIRSLLRIRVHDRPAGVPVLLVVEPIEEVEGEMGCGGEGGRRAEGSAR